MGDPARIAQVGLAGGGFRNEGVVTLADAEAVRQLAVDGYVGDIVRSQLRAADLLLLNKTDLVSSAELTELHAWLAKEVPDARVLECRQGRVSPSLLFGPSVPAADQSAVQSQSNVDSNADGDEFNPASNFISSCFSSTLRLSRNALEEALNTLPPQVIRGKGFVFLDQEDGPRLLQICGKRWTLGRPGEPKAAERSRIVFIAVVQQPDASFDPWRHFSKAIVDKTPNFE